MNFPSKSTFRWLVGVSLSLSIPLYYAQYAEIFSYPHEIEDALALGYLGSPLGETSVNWIYWGFVVADTIAGIGFFFFCSWSRWCLLALTIASPFFALVLGVSVAAPPEKFVDGMSSLFLYLPLVLSFFPPCSGYFENSGKGRDGTADKTNPTQEN
jgi:hypothetical protein